MRTHFLSVVLSLFALTMFADPAHGQATSGNMREALDQLKKGDKASDAGDFAEAKRRFQRATELDNSLVPAWEKLASIYYTEGQYPRAIAIGEEGLKANPGAPELQLWTGLSYQMINRVPEGSALLEKAVAAKPGLFLAYYEPLRKIGLGIYYQKTGADARALASYRAFLKHRPAALRKDVDYLVLFRVGELELRARRAAEALAACEEALKMNNRYSSALWCKAEALRQLGRYAEAVPYFKRVASFGQKKPRVLIGLAISLLHSGNRDASLSTMRRYLTFRPADPEGHQVMGDILYATGKREDAVRSYQRALKLNPAEQAYYVKSAVSQIQLNQFVPAIATLSPALEKWPQDVRILLPLAYAFIQDRRPAEALALLAKAPQEDSAPYLSIYGLAALRTGKSDQAYEILKKALALRPEHEADADHLVTAILDLAYQAVVAGDVAKATGLMSEGQKLRPRDLRLLRNLAILHLMQKKHTEALALLNQGLELAPTDFYFIRLKGRALLSMGKLEEAVALLTDARNRSRRLSTDVQARVEMDLGTALALSEDLERAVAMFTDALGNALAEPKLAALIEMNLVRSLIARAAARLADGRGKEALDDLESISNYKKVTLTKDEDRQMQFLKAMANVEQGKYKEAETMIAALGKAGPIANLFKPPYDTFGPDLLRAYIAYRQNRLDVARRDFRAVVDRAPAEIKNQVYAFLRSCDAIDGSQMLAGGKSQAALNFFNLIPKGTLDAPTMLNYGLALYQSGQQGEAVGVWSQMNTPQAACNLGSHYHNTGDAPNSVKWLKICVGAGLGGPESKTRLEFKQKLFNLQ